MQALVTGATGFTGGHLMKALVREGHRVRAFVRSPEQVKAIEQEGAETFVGQLTRTRDLINAARGCEQIFHIAAVFRTAGHPESYYRDVNVGGAMNALEAARVNGCERLIHCSTVGVHGHIAEPPATEAYRFGPGDIYQRTKLEGERAASAAARCGQPVVIVRPSPIYGEGDTRLLKLFRAIRNGRFVMIGAGNPKFHLVHIDDLTEGFLLCSQRREAVGEIFILAGPDAPTLNQFVARIAQVLEVDPPRLRIPVAPVYAASWLCERICVPLNVEPPLHRRRVGFFTHHREFDTSKAQRLLGYRPGIPFREGVARTAGWYISNGLVNPKERPQGRHRGGVSPLR